MLAEQMEYWGPGTFQQQLDHAYDDFVRYCRRNKLGHSQPPFKVSKVVWRSSFIFLKHIFFDGLTKKVSLESLKDIHPKKHLDTSGVV
jgi:hypothetical protein